MRKFKCLCASAFCAAALIATSAPNTSNVKTYQVTGPVLEVNPNSVVVQKGKDRWEVVKDPSTKVTGDLQVGSKVTITYTMSAQEIDVKPAKKVQ